MPGSLARGTEVALSVRAFRGVMLALDPAFIGSDFLQHADKWRPDQTRVLAKRLGTTPFQVVSGAMSVDRMRYAVSAIGTRYLYAVAHFDAAPDAVWVSTNDGGFVAVTGGTFASSGAHYGMSVLGDTLYVGNDTDPVKSIPLGMAAEDLVPLALAVDAGATVTATADPTAGMLPGTYSFRWCTYNTTTKRWTGIGPVQTKTIDGAGWFRLDFIAPSGGLATDEKWHLFVAGVDQEIEGAHDQTAEGLAVGAPYSATVVTADGTVVPTPSTVERHGRILVTHRGALVGAGDAAMPRRVWSTNVIPPGLEQDIFDHGLFFPAYGFVDVPGPVTGLAVATLTSTQRSPSAPLAIFTESSIHFAIGDFVDDPSFQLVDISNEVGCVSDRTIVSTPFGVLFLGQDSVYLLPPSLREPQRIGWPIEPALRAIPTAAREHTWAMFHKGFYVLACAGPGGLAPTTHWSLDLRHEIGNPPSWWGPDSRPAYTAVARARRHPQEDDRAWGAVDSTGIDASANVVLLEQPATYTDLGQPTMSTFKTARLTESPTGHAAPLQPKLAKRVRVIARVEDSTTLAITVQSDGALTREGEPHNPEQASGTMELPGILGGLWDVSEWDTALWGGIRETKGTYLVPVPEVRGLAFEITATHYAAIGVTLRDLELRVQPAPRQED